MNHRLLNCSLYSRFLFVILLFNAGVAQAESCSYDDGVLAYEQNNLMRAVTLLTMAKKDGDQRADLFLAKHFTSPQNVIALYRDKKTTPSTLQGLSVVAKNMK